MLGTNSLRLITDDKHISAFYVPSAMKKWKSVLGFSGTLSEATLDQMREELKDPIIIDIPSLRKKGLTNKFSSILKTPKEYLNTTIAKKVEE
jgi:hypothetical protein